MNLRPVKASTSGPDPKRLSLLTLTHLKPQIPNQTLQTLNHEPEILYCHIDTYIHTYIHTYILYLSIYIYTEKEKERERERQTDIRLMDKILHYPL